MPAAELTRLREQLNRLAALFDRPADFRHLLTEFLELYADRSYRPGQAVPGKPLLPSYHLPPLVARQLELELIAAVRAHPVQALPVIDELWGQAWFEPRILAAALLGQVPLSQAEGILERLNRWADPSEDRQVLEALLRRGTVRLRAEGPEALFELFGGWLQSTDIPHRSMGLKALLTLAQDRSFENLPPLFDLLFSLVRSAPPALFGDLSTLLTALAERTPTETTYFLRQVLAAPVSKDTPRLARRVFSLLSESQQDSLRNAIKSQK